MKILLYEPGQSGHRPIILRYIKKVIERGLKWEVVVCCKKSSPLRLCNIALKNRCNGIYILTLDGWFLNIPVLAVLCKYYSIFVIGNYYLYNNIAEGWKSLIWRVVLAGRLIDRLHVSAEWAEHSRAQLPALPIRYLPDPWDRTEFPELPQQLARDRLGLKQDSVVFLMFGVIDERKGADLLLRAVQMLQTEKYQDTVKISIVLAGTFSARIKEIAKCLRDKNGIDLIFHDFYIAEQNVSMYFYASDFVVNAYSADFKVSSGVITRAFAAGRVPLIPSHGTNYSIIKKLGCGLIFQTARADSLAEAIRSAVRIRYTTPEMYSLLCERAKAAGAEREYAAYEYRLSRSLSDFIKKDNVAV